MGFAQPSRWIGTDNSYQGSLWWEFFIFMQLWLLPPEDDRRLLMVLDNYSQLKEELVKCIDSVLTVENISDGPESKNSGKKSKTMSLIWLFWGSLKEARPV